VGNKKRRKVPPEVYAERMAKLQALHTGKVWDDEHKVKMSACRAKDWESRDRTVIHAIWSQARITYVNKKHQEEDRELLKQSQVALDALLVELGLTSVHPV
jgi:hypothetical protein